jgi:ATP-dependent DNA helicase RecQ
LKHQLKKIFGFDSFRENQADIIQAIIAGRDVFAVMPTGGGKSLCYQLPAVLSQGMCVVVSPLIALMKDQVDGARENGIRAVYFNSSMNAEEKRSVYSAIKSNELDLLYLAPERLSLTAFFTELQKSAQIAFFAIDEAHCISEWGHDFRPDYLVLSKLKENFPDIPVAAFTASATGDVRKDIVKRLNLTDPLTVRASFNRANIFYQVERKSSVNEQILAFIEKHSEEAGIVYRTTRKAVEETAAFLKRFNIDALPYHAGMDNEDRRKNQDAFNKDEIQVIVATIAFGMGIDKSNVRFVVHGDLPKNIESYYQETGRSGRDGEPAHCLLLHSYGDEATIKYFIDQMENSEEQKRSSAKLAIMSSFANVHICRRKALLKYFGEEYPAANCGSCDICSGNFNTRDATKEAQIFMSAVLRTGESFGKIHIIDIIRGADTQKIRNFNHKNLKTYGSGKENSKKDWNAFADSLFAADAIVQRNDENRQIELTSKGRDILFGRQAFNIIEAVKAAKSTKNTISRRKTITDDYDGRLFEILRKQRTSIAKKANVPPYVVFSDKTLHEMARLYPVSRGSMLQISGVGQMKMRQYGEIFCEEIKNYLSANQ